NGWHCDTAARLLYERQDKSAVPLLEKLVSESANPVAKLHALGALEGLGALREATVIKAMDDKSGHVRELALKLAEHFPVSSFPNTPLWSAVKRMADDPDLRVRFQAALTAGQFMDGDKTIPLLEIIRRDAADPWISAAVLSAPPYVASPMFRDLSRDKKFSTSPAGKEFLRKLVQIIGAKNDAKETAATLAMLTQGDVSASMIRAFAEGLKRAGSSIVKADSDNRLGAIFAKAAATLGDAKAPDAARMEAMQLVSLDSPKQAVPALLACLGKSQSEAVQSAGVSALGQFCGSEVTDALIAHWPDFQRKARTAAFAVMLARPERAIGLLHAIEAKKIAAGELAASDVQALFKHKDKAVAALADKVLAELRPPSRESVIEKFKGAITAKGDAVRGKQVFTQRCVTCHRADGQGMQVGPDLITVKTKGRDGLLTAILDPNKEVAPQFIAYTVETKDGQTFIGLIAKDDASGLTLKMIGGTEQTIPRSQIKGSSSSGQSLMPEGIEAGMDTQAMVDLLTFIEELK
ncbi:MAG: c-type cytochrome, partial [Chthoniobacteraceae bacterium]